MPHTTGPWEVRQKGVAENGGDRGTFIGKVGSGLVARTFTNKSNMQPSECLEAAQADARLIAAAPQMLAALLMLRDDPGLTESTNDVIKCAIRDATGK